ncbi:MAG: sulfurtransferase [Pseudomonadota bacterium]
MAAVKLPPPELVTPAWLSDNLARVVVLDASWHMPDSGRDAATEFENAHIPGAQRFDIDEVADEANPLPHTMPSPDAFAAAAGALGISNESVVVYEAGAPLAAPRAVWMFRAMGHDAKLLDGGLARWRSEGFETESGPARPRKAAVFLPQPLPLFVDADAVAKALSDGGTVVDVRSPERFAGTAPEPREGVRAGHMPGAKNLHYAQLINENGRLKDDAAIAAMIDKAGISRDRPVITTCGSGVTAAILAIALSRQGVDAKVYDGSWTEWGGDPARPLVTGKERP